MQRGLRQGVGLALCQACATVERLLAELSESSGYHDAMRIWMLALMILLLPLRGWLGDAMALGTATPSHLHGKTSTVLIANYQDMARGEVQFQTKNHPCHQDQVPSALMAPDTSTVPSHNDTCTACQICHGAVALPMGWGVSPELTPHPQPPDQQPGFASAEPRLNDKPPTRHA